MKLPLRLAISALRWTLGAVVLLQSALFVLSPSALHSFAKTGLPSWVRPALGGGEIVAAVLFLLPAATLAGGWLLLLIFALAIVIHLLHGDYGVSSLVVYAMAVIVCLAQHHQQDRADTA